ncbi:MAG: EsaB/YukD family protein, partial [Mycobacterium sp.]
MSIPDSGLRRVAVHADTVHADLALPAGVPVAALIPSVVDLMALRDGPATLRPYRLGQPGRAPLDGSKTLAQQGIRDGTMLTLSRVERMTAEPRFDDPAEQVAATVRAAARPWTPVARRLAAVLAASVLAGVTGFVAVPGGPGTPNALLAVAAAGTVAALTVPSSGASPPVRATLHCLAGLAVLAAVVGMASVVTGISLQAIGAAAAAVAVGLIRVAGRVAAMIAGRAGAAHDLLTALVAGSAAAVVLGTAGVAVG